ncbi:MAG TPA: extracellular solute-binding protein, partial [Jiangellaceae bacterium]
MARSTAGRIITAAAGALGLSLVLVACGGDDSGDDGAGGSASNGGSDCDFAADYGDLGGTQITAYSTIVPPEDAPLEASFDKFEECTGATVVYEGSDEFEAQLPVRIQGGTPPDIAIIPQPGLLATLVRDY